MAKPKRQHQIRISANTSDGVSIHGLSEAEATLIEEALAGNVSQDWERDEALALRAEIHKAWDRKWLLKGTARPDIDSENGVAAAQKDFGKILKKADPGARK